MPHYSYKLVIPEEPAPRKGLINKIVVALEDDWPVSVAAQRVFSRFVDEANPGSIAGYAGGQNVLYLLDRASMTLRPVTSVEGLRADEHTRIDIIGRGEIGPRGEGQVSRLNGFQIAELVAPLVPERGVEQVSIVASHAESSRPAAEGALTDGLLYELMMGFRLRLGDGARPNRITAELGNVAIDADGEVRAVNAVAGGYQWVTWDAPYGRVVVEAHVDQRGEMRYQELHQMPDHIPGPSGRLWGDPVRSGLPDSDAGPLLRFSALDEPVPLAEPPHSTPSASMPGGNSSSAGQDMRAFTEAGMYQDPMSAGNQTCFLNSGLYAGVSQQEWFPG